MTQPCLNLKIWQGFFAPKNMNMFLIGGCSILLRHIVDNQSNIIVFVFPGTVSNMNLTIPYISELFLWSTVTCLNLEALTPLLQQGFI